MPEGASRIELLLEAGADPEARDLRGDTLLHYAISYGVSCRAYASAARASAAGVSTARATAVASSSSSASHRAPSGHPHPHHPLSMTTGVGRTREGGSKVPPPPSHPPAAAATAGSATRRSGRQTGGGGTRSAAAPTHRVVPSAATVRPAHCTIDIEAMYELTGERKRLLQKKGNSLLRLVFLCFWE